MGLAIPKLDEGSCVSFNICAMLDTPVRPKPTKPVYVQVKIPKRDVYIRAITDVYKDVRHLHMWIATKRYFVETPKTPDKIADLEKMFGKLKDTSCQTVADATFVVPIKDLPSGNIMASVSVDSKPGQLGVKLVGGKLLITNGPVDSVQWDLDKDDVLVTIRFGKRLICTEQYLVELFDAAQRVFDEFIMGRIAHAD